MSDNIFTVNAPLSGTFYRCPSPDEPPYVEEGQEVNPGQVVCIVESMKIFNEVRVERKGCSSICAPICVSILSRAT